MYIVVFRARLNPAPPADLEELCNRLSSEVSKLPGFVSFKDFTAADGEDVTIAEFESLESIEAWAQHPDHLEAKQRGRGEIFSEYTIHICKVIETKKL